VLKDLRKTCATYYDEHIPESSVEILGHSAGGVTYRHYAHRAPLAFKAIMTIPQPSAFSALARGFDGQCPCCRRRFTDAVGSSDARKDVGATCVGVVDLGHLAIAGNGELKPTAGRALMQTSSVSPGIGWPK
jgi:hypothetical protein